MNQVIYMKKLFLLFFICLMTLTTTNQTITAQENEEAINEVNLSLSAPSAILIEHSTGNILYQKNADQKMYPASMTKMMAIYLFLESISNQTATFSDIVTVSPLASSMGGSQIFLKEYEKMSFEDLFKAVTIASANDAVVALAEHTYGTLETFIEKMNTKAKEFGMNNTNFVNVTGFHDPNHYTTALDMSILAQKLLKDYKDTLLKYTSIYDTYLREDTSSPFWLVNTNRMLKFYQGMDGLKTGYTSDSGFNLTATATRNNMRLITVVMGGETSKSRNQDTATLLDYGYNTYKVVTLYRKGETITNHTFNNAKTENTAIIAKEDITYLTKKNNEPSNINVNVEIEKQDAPINTDDTVGKAIITNPKTGWKTSFDVYAKEAVEELKFKDILLQYYKKILS